MARRIKPFDDSHQKDRRRGTRDQSTDTSAIDAYRQGVELTSPKHFANGIAKIHDGYNDQSGEHGVPQLVYGQERPILRDDNSFLEGVKFDPVSRFEQFSFPVPRISIVDPSSGTSAGGTFVALTGSGFFQVSRVRLDLINQVFTYVDDRHITFTTSAHAAGAVDIDVLTPGGMYTASGSFTFVSGASSFTGQLGTVNSKPGNIELGVT
jgi:hypothetical protein